MELYFKAQFCLAKKSIITDLKISVRIDAKNMINIQNILRSYKQHNNTDLPQFVDKKIMTNQKDISYYRYEKRSEPGGKSVSSDNQEEGLLFE